MALDSQSAGGLRNSEPLINKIVPEQLGMKPLQLLSQGESR
jgi:hypothetical protein